MKYKLICSILAMIAFTQAASPNRYFCNGLGRSGTPTLPAPNKPAAVLVADDSDLLPTQYFLNHI